MERWNLQNHGQAKTELNGRDTSTHKPNSEMKKTLSNNLVCTFMQFSSYFWELPYAEIKIEKDNFGLAKS